MPEIQSAPPEPTSTLQNSLNAFVVPRSNEERWKKWFLTKHSLIEFTVRQKKTMIDLYPVEPSQQPIGILQLRQRLEEFRTVFKVLPFEFAKQYLKCARALLTLLSQTGHSSGAPEVTVKQKHAEASARAT